MMLAYEMLLAAGVALAGRSVRVPIENIVFPKNCNMDDAMQCDFLNEIMSRRKNGNCEEEWRDGKRKSKIGSMDIVNALIDSGVVSSSMMASFDSFLKNTLKCDMNSIPRTGEGMFGKICNNSSIYPSVSPQIRPPASIVGSFPQYCQGPQDPRCRPSSVVRTETVYVNVAAPTPISPIYPSASSRVPMGYPMPYPSTPMQLQASPQQYFPQGISRCDYQMPGWTGYPPQSMAPGGPYFSAGNRTIDNMIQTGAGRYVENRKKNKGRKRKKRVAIKCVCLQTLGSLEDCKCSPA